MSDQYSRYGTKVVSVAEREAIHTLEASLHTQLPILEHTTDTHGATEIVFALFDLLGLRFIRRLRDAGHLLLHLLGPPTGLPVDPVMRGRARPQRIIEQYDDLLRTAASLKRGWVPASLLIARLKNATPQSPLAAALSEYGRIVRTNFLLVYCADPAERARIAGQLDKGETLHALRRHLVIGSRAQIPADEDDHRRHALCLQILVNAVQVWNARYMTASIDHLHATKSDVVRDETAVARVAPVACAHVNSLGRYDLHRQPPPAGHLRPLRRVQEVNERAVLTPPLGVSGDKHQSLDFARMMALPQDAGPGAPADTLNQLGPLRDDVSGGPSSPPARCDSTPTPPSAGATRTTGRYPAPRCHRSASCSSAWATSAARRPPRASCACSSPRPA